MCSIKSWFVNNAYQWNIIALRLRNSNNLLNWKLIEINVLRTWWRFIGHGNDDVFECFALVLLATLSCMEIGSNWYNNHETLCDGKCWFDSFSFFSKNFSSNGGENVQQVYSHQPFNCCTSTCYAPFARIVLISFCFENYNETQKSFKICNKKYRLFYWSHKNCNKNYGRFAICKRSQWVVLGSQISLFFYITISFLDLSKVALRTPIKIHPKYAVKFKERYVKCW